LFKLKRQVAAWHTRLFDGTTPHATWRRINIPTSQSCRVWSLFSAHQSGFIIVCGLLWIVSHS